MGGQFHGEFRHVLTEQRHPGRAVRLLQVAAGGQRGAAVEDADVVEAEKSSFENILAEPVLAVHPPGEVQAELVEGRSEEIEVHLAPQGLLGAVQEESRKGMDRGVDVAEVPFVGGDLPVRVQVGPCSIRCICCFAKSGSTIASGGCERPGPRPRTRGTPTCRASR